MLPCCQSLQHALCTNTAWAPTLRCSSKSLSAFSSCNGHQTPRRPRTCSSRRFVGSATNPWPCNLGASAARARHSQCKSIWRVQSNQLRQSVALSHLCSPFIAPSATQSITEMTVFSARLPCVLASSSLPGSCSCKAQVRQFVCPP